MPGVLVHEWIARDGGSEKVLDEFVRCFPDADVMCLWDDAGRYPGRTVVERALARTPLRHSRALALPVMPFVWRDRPGDYDFALVSSHCFAHHVSFRAASPGFRKYVYVQHPGALSVDPRTRRTRRLAGGAAGITRVTWDRPSSCPRACAVRREQRLRAPARRAGLGSGRAGRAPARGHAKDRRRPGLAYATRRRRIGSGSEPAGRARARDVPVHSIQATGLGDSCRRAGRAARGDRGIRAGGGAVARGRLPAASPRSTGFRGHPGRWPRTCRPSGSVPKSLHGSETDGIRPESRVC